MSNATSPDNLETRVRLRETLRGVPSYKPGKPASGSDGGGAAHEVYKISSNENPYPPLPSVVSVVADAANRMNRYPDMASSELTEKLAKYLGVSSHEVSFGTGSVGILAALIAITCEPGDEVVYPWRSFEAYPIVVALAGARSVQVPNQSDGAHDLAAMENAITPKTRLVIVCTPNNPTGPALHEAKLRDFLSKISPETLVVIDEAYLEFVTADDAPDALALYREFSNVVILRTFSKAYGLAGLRVGYAIARPVITDALRKAATPFGVTEIAQRAAIASIDAFDELQERVDKIVAERERVTAELAKAGIDIPQAQGNFVWFPVGDRAAEFASLATQNGLVVRAFDGDGVRCTIDVPAANDRLLETAKQFYRV